MIPMSVRLAQTDRDRKANIYDLIRMKSQECYFLRITYNFAVAKYYHPDTPGEYYDEILEPARLELNTCVDELNELQDTETYGPRIPWLFARGDLDFKDPEPAPTEPVTGGTEEEAPGGGPATIAPWPSEIPEPTTEPIPPPPPPFPPTNEVEPELLQPQVTEAPQASAAAACDPLHGTFYDPRTGQCRGSIGNMPISPFTSFGPSSTVPLTQSAPFSEGVSSFMSGRRIQAAPLRAGRF